jgi:NTP pyrophosphatase (non-canonical NTP hydrolase)
METLPKSTEHSLTLDEAQRVVDEWIKRVGVRYFSELTNLAQLVEEVGELARILSRTYGDQSAKASDKDRNLADEMADVLFVLICLANQTGVNLTDALRANLDKKTKRDATRHLENPKLATPSQQEH